MTADRWPEIDPDTYQDERVEADFDSRAAYETRRFHDECGFAWSVHDNSDPLTTLPFGCPTEVVARLRWGRG